MKLSKHAKLRAQQRGIPEWAIDLLSLYGSESYQKGGCHLLTMNSRQRKRATNALKRLLDVLQNDVPIYAVVTGKDEVVTVGHRYRSGKKKFAHHT